MPIKINNKNKKSVGDRKSVEGSLKIFQKSYKIFRHKKKKSIVVNHNTVNYNI